MRLRYHVWIFLGLSVLCLCCVWLAAQYTERFSRLIFIPFQNFRIISTDFIPWSLGDILYICAIVYVLWLVIYMLQWLVKKKWKHGKRKFIVICIVTLNLFMFFNLMYIAGWSGNYYKEPLHIAWDLKQDIPDERDFLVSFDSFLLQRLNDYVPGYHPSSYSEMEAEACRLYHTLTDGRLTPERVKPSIFGNWLQFAGIQGYYNPFTGEAQVNNHLPSYVLPFVICHEIAHQYGIASEESANLLAYAVCTASDDSSFRYSAYFQLWLYAHSNLYRMDSIKAKSLKVMLPELSQRHLDTLRALRKKYHSPWDDISSMFYDRYLKMYGQPDGIKNYGRVSLTAWLYEQKKDAEQRPLPIKIP
jgi:hypothetical protein